jgi:hypothetical protein
MPSPEVAVAVLAPSATIIQQALTPMIVLDMAAVTWTSSLHRGVDRVVDRLFAPESHRIWRLRSV